MNISKSDMLMKNNIQFSDAKSHQSLSVKQKKETKESKNSLYAGNLNMMQRQNDLASKKAQTQKQAIKSVMDQYKNDAKVDQGIEDRQEHQTQLTNDAKQYQEQIDSIDGTQKKIKDAYGITDDSKEEKDLNILRKSVDPDQTLSDDEMEQLKNMGPLTEYQTDSLKLDAAKNVFQIRIKSANSQIAGEHMAIESIKLEMVKSHPMVDAQKAAAEIMQKAIKDAVGTLMNQAKDDIDADFEKKKEEVQKQEEKKAEEEKKKEAMKSKDDQSGNVAQNQETQNTKADNTMNDVQAADTQQDKIQIEVKKVVKKMNMLEEDVKGVAVDNTI
jgi:hypothetical protein